MSADSLNEYAGWKHKFKKARSVYQNFGPEFWTRIYFLNGKYFEEIEGHGERVAEVYSVQEVSAEYVEARKSRVAV